MKQQLYENCFYGALIIVAAYIALAYLVGSIQLPHVNI
jgi:hypothetical protein